MKNNNINKYEAPGGVCLDFSHQGKKKVQAPPSNEGTDSTPKG